MAILKPSILIVDDEISFRSVIVELLQEAGYSVTGAESGEKALSLLDQALYKVVFADLRMPGIDGLTLLKEIKRRDAAIEVIMVTSHTSVASAIEALRLGAYDYLIKPLDDIEQVLAVVKRVSDKISLEAEKKRLLEDLQKTNRELKESNQKVIQYSLDIAALYTAEKEILAGLDLLEVYQRAVTGLSKLVGLRPVMLWTAFDSGRSLMPDATADLDLADRKSLILRLAEPPAPPAWSLPAPLKERILQKIPAKSALFYPVSGHQKLLAYLAVFDSKPNAFLAREEEILSRFSSSVALAIENATLYEKVKAMAIRDGLTGLYNRRHFEESLHGEIIRSIRYRQPVSLIFIDVDHFKNYNDSQGHQMGDEVLKEIANLIVKRVRVSDIVCRYGGEEFTVILPYTDKETAKTVAEDIRTTVQNYPFPHREQQPGRALTISLGIAEGPADAHNQDDLVKKADEALYRAKQSGRNRICV